MGGIFSENKLTEFEREKVTFNAGRFLNISA